VSYSLLKWFSVGRTLLPRTGMFLLWKCSTDRGAFLLSFIYAIAISLLSNKTA